MKPIPHFHPAVLPEAYVLFQPVSAEARILVVEDDDIVREIIVAYLQGAGLATIEANSVETALGVAARNSFDLTLVDISLPDGSGFDLVKSLRRGRDCAVIYLTSLGGTDNRVRGLEGGGDDYIVKPVETRELLARVRAVLRRFRRRDPPSRPSMPVIEYDGWTVDLVRRELASPDGAMVRLTRAEFDILAALLQAGGTSLSRDYLLEVVGSVERTTKPRTIDVMVSRIRRKLDEAGAPLPRIRTRTGEGYSVERAWQ